MCLLIFDLVMTIGTVPSLDIIRISPCQSTRRPKLAISATKRHVENENLSSSTSPPNARLQSLPVSLQENENEMDARVRELTEMARGVRIHDDQHDVKEEYQHVKVVSGVCLYIICRVRLCPFHSLILPCQLAQSLTLILSASLLCQSTRRPKSATLATKHHVENKNLSLSTSPRNTAFEPTSAKRNKYLSAQTLVTPTAASTRKEHTIARSSKWLRKDDNPRVGASVAENGINHISTSHHPLLGTSNFRMHPGTNDRMAATFNHEQTHLQERRAISFNGSEQLQPSDSSVAVRTDLNPNNRSGMTSKLEEKAGKIQYDTLKEQEILENVERALADLQLELMENEPFETHQHLSSPSGVTTEEQGKESTMNSNEDKHTALQGLGSIFRQRVTPLINLEDPLEKLTRRIAEVVQSTQLPAIGEIITAINQGQIDSGKVHLQSREQLLSEIEYVTAMMDTTNDEVKNCCQHCLSKLQFELENLPRKQAVDAEMMRRRSESRQQLVSEVQNVTKLMTMTLNDDIRMACKECIVNLKSELEKLTNNQEEELREREPDWVMGTVQAADDKFQELRSMRSAVEESLGSVGSAVGSAVEKNLGSMRSTMEDGYAELRSVGSAVEDVLGHATSANIDFIGKVLDTVSDANDELLGMMKSQKANSSKQSQARKDIESRDDTFTSDKKLDTHTPKSQRYHNEHEPRNSTEPEDNEVNRPVEGTRSKGSSYYICEKSNYLPGDEELPAQKGSWSKGVENGTRKLFNSGQQMHTTITPQMDKYSDPSSPKETHERSSALSYTARNKNDNLSKDEQDQLIDATKGSFLPQTQPTATNATGDSSYANRGQYDSSEEIKYTKGKKKSRQSQATDKNRGTSPKGILRKSSFGAHDQTRTDSCHKGADISTVDPTSPKIGKHRADKTKQAAPPKQILQKRNIGEKTKLSPSRASKETQEKDKGECKRSDCQQGLYAEIQRVENMLITTTNNEVRDWCDQRLHKLSRDLDNIINVPVASDPMNTYEIETQGRMELASGNLVEKVNSVRYFAGKEVDVSSDISATQKGGMSLLGLKMEEKSKDFSKKVGETIKTVASVVEEQADDISTKLGEAVQTVGSSLESTIDGASGILGRVIQTVESAFEDINIFDM